MITLLTADDHPIIKEGLARWVNTLDDITLLGSASSLPELHALLEVHSPDVIVMDYRMPAMQGAASVRALCEQGHRVIMFTSTEEQVIIQSLCDSGICGFISKSASIADLIEAVRKVADGHTILPSSQDASPMPHQTLSERERRVFEGLIQRKSPKEIAFDLGLAASSIYTYAERVRTKIGVEDSRALIQYAYEVGLLETKS